MVDAFSAIMARATSTSIIEGFSIDRNGVKISHLQFTDDTICFTRDEEQQVSHLKLILQIFEKISDLKVNFLKCWLVGIGVDNGQLIRFAQIMGCRVEQWPLQYLGMPLGGT